MPFSYNGVYLHLPVALSKDRLAVLQPVLPSYSYENVLSKTYLKNVLKDRFINSLIFKPFTSFKKIANNVKGEIAQMVERLIMNRSWSRTLIVALLH